jgi:hypothetical protein
VSDYQKQASLYALFLIGGLCLLAVIAEVSVIGLCLLDPNLSEWATSKCSTADFKNIFIEIVGVFGAAWGVQRISNGKG